MASGKRSKLRNFDLVRFLDGNRGSKRVDFRRGHLIFAQGEPDRHTYYVLRGQVKVSIISKQGKEAVVGILGPKDFLGEQGIAGPKVRMISARAATDCELLRLENRWLTHALRRERAFSDYFVAYLLLRKAQVEEALVDQLFNSSEKRLARALLVMARSGKNAKRETTIPKISQETLASMIGTTRSRVSYFMNKFRKMGFINYNGTLQVNTSLVNVLLRD